ncbi:Random slug protein 5 [Morella rubra]|uniref:Random slug protein 5 n=1 Tax=Morella rubra TaxID=262757 RepID=A0A6A1V501_9ROSI|nr:Random slug protein 5 [Morella rubra]KAB1207435.1 Random slug protein 5 [Morella rubra]
MSGGSKKSHSNGVEKLLTSDEQQAKINELRRLMGPLPDKLSMYCSDVSISRYLRARNWNVKKATKMLKDSLKWRLEYKPEEIRWEDVAHEAETGKIYRSNSVDKLGRTVLVMRPSRQNSKSTKGQIKYLVYCMENAILNLPPDQEQMVWLIDFDGFNLSNISVRVTKETAHVLQDQYPERLGVAILYNPPKFFEPFWTLESAFGGNSDCGFEINKYAERMREDDKRMSSSCTSGNPPSTAPQPDLTSALDSINLGSESDHSDSEKTDGSPSQVAESEVVPPGQSVVGTDGSKTAM